VSTRKSAAERIRAEIDEPFGSGTRPGGPGLGRLGPDAILAVLRRRARRAGVADFSAHDLRRTFICEALEAGADLAAVQQLGGAPQRHHHRPLRPPAEAARRQAARRVRGPYVARA
jgi:integrase